MGSREIRLTQRQRSIIIGSLLGDGAMERNGRYPRLKFDHGMAQERYVRWLKEELAPFSGTLRIVQSWHYAARKSYRRWNFATYSRPEFEEFYSLFYSKGKRGIPNQLEKFLDPIGLAVWYMDDGHKRTDCNALRIHTNAFTVQETKFLQCVLERKFGVDTRLHHVRRGIAERTLYVPSGSNAERLISIVRPHIHASMQYKISLTP